MLDSPPQFLFGKKHFDTWLVNYFMLNFGNLCYDVEPTAKSAYHAAAPMTGAD